VLDGFEGKMTNKKWSALAKCSSDTALRDITDLMNKGLLQAAGAGRGTSYEIVSN
jgi:Fic family protein